MTETRWPCKTCGALIGDRCTNYRGRICAPHRGRKPKPRKAAPKKHNWGPPAPRSVQSSLFDAPECLAGTYTAAELGQGHQARHV